MARTRTVLREFAEPHFVRRGPASVFGRPLDQTQGSGRRNPSQPTLLLECQTALARLTPLGAPQAAVRASGTGGAGSPSRRPSLGRWEPNRGVRVLGGPGRRRQTPPGRSPRAARGLHQGCIGPYRPFFENVRIAPLWLRCRSRVAVLLPCCSAAIPHDVAETLVSRSLARARDNRAPQMSPLREFFSHRVRAGR